MDKSDISPLSNCDERIAFVLGHPGFSGWLKDAVRSALGREPLAVLNDLEILVHVLKSKYEMEATKRTE